MTPTRSSADGTETWSRAGGVLSRRTMRGVVVLAPGATEPLALLGSALDVWTLLADPMSINELVDALSESYRVDPREIAADTEWVVSTLSQVGAVCRR